jgi:hypothetical protein
MPTDRPNVSYARRDATEHCLAEARRLAHQVEELLVEAAKDPNVDAYSLRVAQGLARSLIDQLIDRPASSSRLAQGASHGERGLASGGSGRNGSGSAQVA